MAFTTSTTASSSGTAIWWQNKIAHGWRRHHLRGASCNPLPEVTIKLPGVQYEFDKFALTQNGKDSPGDALSDHGGQPDHHHRAARHTDSRGSDAYNLT